MKKLKLLNQLAMGLGLSVAVAGAAVAAPIASFDYTQEFEFTTSAPAGVVPSGVTDDDSGTNATASTADDASNVDGNTKLAWGTNNPQGLQSSLVINHAGDFVTPSGDLTSGTVNVATDINAMTFELGPQVTHNNFAVDAPLLSGATARDYVVLDPSDGSADVIQDITFGIFFEETLNSLTGANCPSGDINAGGCGDIFVLAGGLLGAPTVVNNVEVAFLIDNFVRDGYLYEVFLRDTLWDQPFNGIRVLSDVACAAAGASSGCIGFTTSEGLSNTFQLEFAILASEYIPAPGTMTLFAGSLLLMGLVRRRKLNS